MKNLELVRRILTALGYCTGGIGLLLVLLTFWGTVTNSSPSAVQEAALAGITCLHALACYALPRMFHELLALVFQGEK